MAGDFPHFGLFHPKINAKKPLLKLNCVDMVKLSTYNIVMDGKVFLGLPTSSNAVAESDILR